jgi:hypothetical protein
MDANFAKNAPSAVIDVQATVTPVVPAPAPVPIPEVTPAPAPVPVPVPEAAPTPAPQPAPVAVPAPQPVAAAAPAPTTAVAPVANTSIARGRSLVLGDKIPDFKDVILPRLNIAQSIGDLGKTFDPGSICFDQRVLLFSPPIIDTKAGVVTKPGLPPISIVCLGFRPTRYVEKVEGGDKGLIVASEDQVKTSGGTLDYREYELKKASGMKRFEALAEALIAIQRPDHLEDDDTVFVYPVEGKKYALALWAIKGTAYTAACKKVLFMQRAVGYLNKGYPTRELSLTTRWQKFENGNGAWVPVMIPGKATTPEFLAWVAGVINPVEADSQGAE